MPNQRRDMTPNHAALFDDIQAGRKLRKVASSEKNHKSQAASPGRASDDDLRHTYNETPHSRNVEDRERGQASTRTWSDAGDGENESERMRAFKQGLAAKFGRVPPTVPATSIGNDNLMLDDRRRAPVNAEIEKAGNTNAAAGKK
tara:strand:+ start:6854 stop:7288 length:435 start_codon:yes stop_codon:yes gene_type:complete